MASLQDVERREAQTWDELKNGKVTKLLLYNGYKMDTRIHTLDIKNICKKELITHILKNNITHLYTYNITHLYTYNVLPEIIKKSKSIKHLSVHFGYKHYPGLLIKSVNELSKALSKNNSLQELHLGSNNIGTKGAEEIAKALSKNTSLKSLYLGNNNIGDDGAEALSKMLYKNTSLQTLYLYGNISQPNLDEIDALLERNRQLTKEKWMPIVLNFPKLPTYVILDIVDTYPDYHLLNQYQKVCFIDYCKAII
jgi:hypothetical protein